MGFLLLSYSIFRLEFSLICPNDKPVLDRLLLPILASPQDDFNGSFLKKFSSNIHHKFRALFSTKIRFPSSLSFSILDPKGDVT